MEWKNEITCLKIHFGAYQTAKCRRNICITGVQKNRACLFLEGTIGEVSEHEKSEFRAKSEKCNGYG